MAIQSSLKGVYRRRIDGCPHKHGMPDWPDICDLNDGRVCIYETAEAKRGCETFRSIIREWETEIRLNTGNCACGEGLLHFSGLERCPEYLYCPKCNNEAYDPNTLALLFKLV